MKDGGSYQERASYKSKIALSSEWSGVRSARQGTTACLSFPHSQAWKHPHRVYRKSDHLVPSLLPVSQGLYYLWPKWPQQPTHWCPASTPCPHLSYPLPWNKPLQDQFIQSHDFLVFLCWVRCFLYSCDVTGPMGICGKMLARQKAQVTHST